MIPILISTSNELFPRKTIQCKNSLRNHLNKHRPSSMIMISQLNTTRSLLLDTSWNAHILHRRKQESISPTSYIYKWLHLYLHQSYTYNKLYLQHTYTRSLTLGTHLYTEASPWSTFDLNTRKHYPFAHKRYLPNDLHTNLRSLRGRVQQNGHSHRKNNPVMIPS